MVTFKRNLLGHGTSYPGYPLCTVEHPVESVLAGDIDRIMEDGVFAGSIEPVG